MSKLIIFFFVVAFFIYKEIETKQKKNEIQKSKNESIKANLF